ncbi:DivIVA domain-containing protein [uncultured Dialister sp.]|uniref:DivIVA domain-containing protein n=1 Tax=uncultured Dialister sp. TaxID=278064 RepID=UPI002629B179|nr:DivIVA domain-containing protein [uncultured Dialister sp.]
MITPMDIHNKTFSKGLRGYSEEEVNDFLRQIVADYEQIYREHREMEEQMDQMKTKLANYEKISETMTNTLQLAKDTAENVKKNAKRNAEILIANAHAEGNRQIREAEESRRRLVENMIRTEGNMKTYVGKIRRDLELALAAIDALDRMEAPKVAGFPSVGEKTEEPKAEEAPTAEAPTAEAPTNEEAETEKTAEPVETDETAEAPETEEKAEAEEAPAEETEEKKE